MKKDINKKLQSLREKTNEMRLIVYRIKEKQTELNQPKGIIGTLGGLFR